MPDISKCEGGDCKKKEACYRFTSEPSEFRQSYFSAPPLNEDGTCDHYWESELVTKIVNKTND